MLIEESPSINSLPSPSRVIVPAPLFFISKTLPIIPTAVGSVTVNVLAVQSIKSSVRTMVYVADIDADNVLDIIELFSTGAVTVHINQFESN